MRPKHPSVHGSIRANENSIANHVIDPLGNRRLLPLDLPDLPDLLVPPDPLDPPLDHGKLLIDWLHVACTR